QVGIELLAAGYKEAETLAGRRKFKDAAALISTILNFKGLTFIALLKSEADVQNRFGKSFHGMSAADFENILVRYGQYAVEGRDFDNAISIANKYKRLFPSNADFLLLLGDAYYGKRDKKNASEAYVLYT